MNPVEVNAVARKKKGSGALSAIVAVLAVVGVFALVALAMWQLPALFVNEDAYRLSSGKVDAAAVQDAYNAARAPLGIATAAVLAATAAAAGVYMNARTVAVARASVELSRSTEEQRRGEWREEQYSIRFQDAAKQLGDEAAAVRLAGAYALVRLADEWKDHRGSCVAVLCAYARMPLEAAGDVRERQVRRAIAVEVLRRLRLDGDTWLGQSIDLRGAIIEDVDESNLVLDDLDLEGATLISVNLSGRCSGELKMAHSTFSGPCKLSILQDSGAARLSFSNVTVGKQSYLKLHVEQAVTAKWPMSLHKLTCLGYMDIALKGKLPMRAAIGGEVRVPPPGLVEVSVDDIVTAPDEVVLLSAARGTEGNRIAVSDELRGKVSLKGFSVVEPPPF